MTTRSPTSRCRLTQASANGRTAPTSSRLVIVPPHHPDGSTRKEFPSRAMTPLQHCSAPRSATAGTRIEARSSRGEAW
ncbi:hypothetical protein ADK76_20540 [Streptomyces griseoflavus]|nr:hypothetical protein ADK76_20540 [Streptomyces griseoflavus]